MNVKSKLPYVVLVAGLTIVTGSVTIQQKARELVQKRPEPVALMARAPAAAGPELGAPDTSRKIEISETDLMALVDDKELRREIALREWDLAHRSKVDQFDKIVDLVVKLIGAVTSLFGVYQLGKRNGQG